MTHLKKLSRRLKLRIGLVAVAGLALCAVLVGQATADDENGGAVQYVLYDDLGNWVYPSPETNAPSGDDDSGGSTKDNNGHGNNIDGADSSNQGKSDGKGGPGTTDASCTDTGICIDDEKNKK